MKKIFYILSFLPIAVFSQTKNVTEIKGPYFGQKPPGTTPEIFAPGIITTELTEHGTVTFSPDGNEVFWAVIYSDPFRKKIMTMKNINNQWTHPEIASFSLGENEGNPFSSPDGKMVFFTGWRSAEGYRGDKHLIMYSEKTNSGWSAPKLIDPIINTVCKYWHTSTSLNGNLYFSSEIDGGGIFCSKYNNGKYLAPNKIIDGATPYIAPDESYLIFSSKREDGFGEIDLYISYHNDDNTWTKGVNLGELINSNGDDLWPIVSPCGKYLFFTSSRSGNMDIYWVSAKIVEELKSKNLK